jgi:multidrug efflux pump subunit AcrB
MRWKHLDELKAQMVDSGRRVALKLEQVNLAEIIVVNFQSWLDPFIIIITALTAALAGIVLFLFVTHMTLSVPALMGAIICMGAATANSILVIAFAEGRLLRHGGPIEAANEAGYTHFRPVLMTALAMILV